MENWWASPALEGRALQASREALAPSKSAPSARATELRTASTSKPHPRAQAVEDFPEATAPRPRHRPGPGRSTHHPSALRETQGIPDRHNADSEILGERA